MADFPLPVLRDAVRVRVDPRRVSVSRNGNPKARLLQPSPINRFLLPARGLTHTEYDAFNTFYDANRAATITLKWPLADGSTVSYSCIFGPAEIRWSWAEGKWSTSIELLEIR